MENRGRGPYQLRFKGRLFDGIEFYTNINEKCDTVAIFTNLPEAFDKLNFFDFIFNLKTQYYIAYKYPTSVKITPKTRNENRW